MKGFRRKRHPARRTRYATAWISGVTMLAILATLLERNPATELSPQPEQPASIPKSPLEARPDFDGSSEDRVIEDRVIEDRVISETTQPQVTILESTPPTPKARTNGSR